MDTEKNLSEEKILRGIFLTLQQIENALDDDIRRLCEPLSIKITQAKLLLKLCHNDSVTTSELARVMNIGKSAFSLLCKRLEQKGLLQKRRKSSDQRIVYISLTPDGEQIAAELTEKIKSRRDSQLNSISENSLIEIYQNVLLLWESLETAMAPV